jgi:hypothetical protein
VTDSLSLITLEKEREELRKDFVAFSKAYDIVRHRLLESSEADPGRGAALERWSGTWACIGSLELTSKTIENKILGINDLIEKIQSGEIQNSDQPERPRLGVLDGGKGS